MTDPASKPQEPTAKKEEIENTDASASSDATEPEKDPLKEAEVNRTFWKQNAKYVVIGVACLIFLLIVGYGFYKLFYSTSDTPQVVQPVAAPVPIAAPISVSTSQPVVSNSQPIVTPNQLPVTPGPVVNTPVQQTAIGGDNTVSELFDSLFNVKKGGRPRKTGKATKTPKATKMTKRGGRKSGGDCGCVGAAPPGGMETLFK